MNKLDCGHYPSEHSEHTTGYVITKGGMKICRQCCAEHDRQEMIRSHNSKALPLYLIEKDNRPVFVSNWPRTLKFAVKQFTKGKHNIAGSRIDVWFNGPDGGLWHGVQYGQWTQIVHCLGIRGRN